MVIDLKEVWRDKLALSEIQAEITRQSSQGWKPWEILLPPELLYPMIEEVSQRMFAEWSPTILGVGIQLGSPQELGIRFVLPGLKTSPVMLKTMRYTPSKKDDIIPIEVSCGR